jgi:hypothetical protein
MPLNWSTTAQHALTHGVKVLVHGRSGAGKTVLAATAPSPLILSAEAGTLSIAGANLPILVINSMKDLGDAYEFCRSSAEANRFSTIGLDSISEIAEKLLSEEKAKNKDPRKAYGEMMDQVAVLVRLFRDLPGKNVYFACKSELKEQPDLRVKYSPSMPGKQVGPGLPYFFDEVFYLGIGETPDKKSYRYLQTDGDDTCEAKDRSGALDRIEHPNLTNIFNKIRAKFGLPLIA